MSTPHIQQRKSKAGGRPAVLALLQKPMTIKQIAEDMRIHSTSVRELVVRLIKLQQVRIMRNDDPARPADAHMHAAVYVATDAPPPLTVIKPTPPAKQPAAVAPRRQSRTAQACEAAVFEEIMDGPATVQQLVNRTDELPHAVRAALRAMAQRFEVERIDPDHPEAPPRCTGAVWRVTYTTPAARSPRHASGASAC